MDVEKTGVAPSDDQADDVMSAEDENRYKQLKREEEIFQAQQRKAELAHLERKKIEREASKKLPKKVRKKAAIEQLLAPKPKVTIDQITQGATQIITEMFQAPIPESSTTNPEIREETIDDEPMIYNYQTDA